MNDWHFLRPEALWLLCFPLLYVVGRFVVKYRNSYAAYIPREVLPYLLKRSRGYKESVFRMLPVVAFTVGVLALAGPVTEKQKQDKREPLLSVALVMDMSDKLAVQDVNALKWTAYHLLDSLEHERVSLVVQGGSSHILIPFTADYRLVRSYMEWVSPAIMPGKGNKLNTLSGKIQFGSESDLNAVVYLTPEMDEHRMEEWKSLFPDSVWKRIIISRSVSAHTDPDIVPVGIEGEGVMTVLSEMREAVRLKMEKEEQKDAALWKDEGYIWCWVVTVFFFPLFLRYRRGVMLGLLVLSLSSCSYTEKRWNEARVGFYLWRGDTLKAAEVADAPLLRGMLQVKMGNPEKAWKEFMCDTTCESMYNGALAAYYSGHYLEALRLFREVGEKRPDWEFVIQNIQKLESWLTACLIEEGELPRQQKEDTEADSYEKDRENDNLDGSEEELWADKLVNDGKRNLTAGKDCALKRGEVLFRQVENNPEEFLKRRLQYEYELSE